MNFMISRSIFLDYLSDKYLIFIDENSKYNKEKENIIIENNNLIKSLVEKERIVPESIKMLVIMNMTIQKKANNILRTK